MSVSRNSTPIKGPLLLRNCKKTIQARKNAYRRYIQEELSMSSTNESDSESDFDDYIRPRKRYLDILNKPPEKNPLFTANVPTRIRKSLINQAIVPVNVIESPKQITPTEAKLKFVRSTPFPNDKLTVEPSFQISPISHEHLEDERRFSRRSNSIQQNNEIRQAPSLDDSEEEHCRSHVSENGSHFKSQVHENSPVSLGKHSKLHIPEQVSCCNNRADVICPVSLRIHPKSLIPVHVSRSCSRSDVNHHNSEEKRSRSNIAEQVSCCTNQADVNCADSVGKRSKSHISQHISHHSNRIDVHSPSQPNFVEKHSRSHVSKNVNCSNNIANEVWSSETDESCESNEKIMEMSGKINRTSIKTYSRNHSDVLSNYSSVCSFQHNRSKALGKKQVFKLNSDISAQTSPARSSLKSVQSEKGEPLRKNDVSKLNRHISVQTSTGNNNSDSSQPGRSETLKKKDVSRSHRDISVQTCGENDDSNSTQCNKIRTLTKKDVSLSNTDFFVQPPRGNEYSDYSLPGRTKTLRKKDVSKSNREISIRTCEEDEDANSTQSSKIKTVTKKDVSKLNKDVSVHTSKGNEWSNPSKSESCKALRQTCGENDGANFTQSNKSKTLTKEAMSKSNKDMTVRTSSVTDDFDFTDFKRSNYVPWRFDLSAIGLSSSKKPTFFNSTIMTNRTNVQYPENNSERNSESWKENEFEEDDDKRTYFKKKRISLPYNKKLQSLTDSKFSTTKRGRRKVDKVLNRIVYETDDDTNSSDSLSVIECFPDKKRIVSSAKKRHKKILKEPNLYQANFKNNENEIWDHLSNNKQLAEAVQNGPTTTLVKENNIKSNSKELISKENEHNYNGYKNKNHSDLVSYSTTTQSALIADLIRRGKSILDCKTRERRKSIHGIIKTLRKSGGFELRTPVLKNDTAENCERATGTSSMVIENLPYDSNLAEVRNNTLNAENVITESCIKNTSHIEVDQKLNRENQVEVPQDFHEPRYSDYFSHKKRNPDSSKIPIQNNESGYNSREVVINIQRIQVIDPKNNICDGNVEVIDSKSKKQPKVSSLDSGQNQSNVTPQNMSASKSVIESATNKSNELKHVKPKKKTKRSGVLPLVSHLSRKRRRIAKLKKIESKDRINCTSLRNNEKSHQIKSCTADLVQETSNTPSSDVEELQEQGHSSVTESTKISKKTKALSVTQGRSVDSTILKRNKTNNQLKNNENTSTDVNITENAPSNQWVTLEEAISECDHVIESSRLELNTASEKETDTATNLKCLLMVERDVAADPEFVLPSETGKRKNEVTVGGSVALLGASKVETTITSEGNEGIRKSARRRNQPYDKTRPDSTKQDKKDLTRFADDDPISERGHINEPSHLGLNTTTERETDTAANLKHLLMVERDVAADPEFVLPSETGKRKNEVTVDGSVALLGASKVETTITSEGNEDIRKSARRRNPPYDKSRPDSTKQVKIYLTRLAEDDPISECGHINEPSHLELNTIPKGETDTATNKKRNSEKKLIGNGNSTRYHLTRKRLFILEEEDVEADPEFISPSKMGKSKNKITMGGSVGSFSTSKVDTSTDLVSTAIETASTGEGNEGLRRSTSRKKRPYDKTGSDQIGLENNTPTNLRINSKKKPIGNSTRSNHTQKHLVIEDGVAYPNFILPRETRSRKKKVINNGSVGIFSASKVDTFTDHTSTSIETTTTSDGNQGLRRSTRKRNPPYDKTGYDQIMNVRFLDDIEWLKVLKNKAGNRTKNNNKEEENTDSSKSEKSRRGRKMKSEEKNHKAKDEKKKQMNTEATTSSVKEHMS